ncbi:DUF349 domain-containing protein [Ketobacter alkanivorans]|uniref:DUF349 domain-containing protein n=1 Tax=Ketobacter alkanivorans TaxID=1917421 RepID=A0A2K9LMA9_9GAMM|nr:DUF349 domain-containing protein [Ketobacter alkanivorans]AUM13403.1 hypothetical protein Kalk_13665 [Ketobacter alkanivorans]
MFKNLFKPKWQSAKPQVRIQALQNLNLSDDHDFHILELMAKGDVENEVRLAAIKRIPQRDKLLNLIKQEKDGSVRFAAIEHLIAVLAESGGGIDPVVRDMVLELDGHALAAIVEQTENADLGCLAISKISDEALLEGYAVKLPLALMRQTAAAKLQAEDVLERVVKASKGKDKSVWRICKDKLNALREEQQQEASIEQQLAELCQNLEMLSRLPYDNLYGPKLEHFQKQWQRMQHHADNETIHRFNRAYALCKATIDDISNEQDRLAEETKQQREALQERMAACEQLEEAVRQLSSIAVLQPSDIPALQALLNTQKTRWEEAAGVVEPAADERKRFTRIHGLLQRALDAVRKLGEHDEAIRNAATAVLGLEEATMATLQTKQRQLEKALGDLKWPEELAWPESLKLHQQALDHFERLRSKAKVMEDDAINNIKSIFNELSSEIEQGHLKPANRLLKEASQLVKHLPIKAASGYQKKLRELTLQVNELRDWQGFVATPKKEELISAMESLVGTDMDPQALSTKIRRLQDEWRGLGEADKGRNKELWDRFSAAADQAYEPCRGYFDKLSEVRQVNLDKRKNVCAQLEAYLQQYDWDNADWKAVNEVYNTAKSEWRLYTPVERKEGKKVQDQFNGLLDQLRDRLHGEFERNRVKREKLIEAVDALLEVENLAEAIEQAKSLQRDWRNVGMVARRDDARLWKRFRAACDKVFERRDQQREEVQKERAQNFVHGEHLCEQIEQLAESDLSDVKGARQEFRQLTKRYQDLGPIPRDQQDVIKARFQAVCDQFEAAIVGAEVALRQQGFKELWRRAAICDELEDSLVTANQGDLFGVAPESEWHSEQSMPVGAEAVLQARYDAVVNALKSAQVPTQDQLTENAERLHELCLKLEIAVGVDSPAEDQQKRMALQINRLNDGLTHRGDAVSSHQQVEQMQVEWAGIGPVATADRERFSKRFIAVLEKAKG